MRHEQKIGIDGAAPFRRPNSPGSYAQRRKKRKRNLPPTPPIKKKKKRKKQPDPDPYPVRMCACACEKHLPQLDCQDLRLADLPTRKHTKTTIAQSRPKTPCKRVSISDGTFIVQVVRSDSTAVKYA
jgi:hypothetical protein